MTLWESFHFLRPLWLMVIIPAVIITFMLKQMLSHKNSWKKIIAPHLLPYLLDDKKNQGQRSPLFYLLMASWIISCISLAGPTWEKVSVPVSKNQHPLVVVADMSINMLATDMKPNRFVRLKYKLMDLFKDKKEGLTALVVFAGSAHTVAPLTDDNRTLSNLVNAISPEIMPEPGNNPSDGIQKAINLIKQGTGKSSGNILLLTNQVTHSEAKKIETILHKTGSTLSIIGIGEEQGAPIPLAKGGFLKDSHGNIIIPQLSRDNMIELSKLNNGHYHDLTIDSIDLQTTIPKVSKNAESIEVEGLFDQWHDAGFWLIFLLIPLALGSFRKGWLTLALLAILYPQSKSSVAMDWESLWKNGNQRGEDAMKEGKYSAAASLFNNVDRKAQALYKAEQYKESAELFGTSSTVSNLYNKGNALANSGQLKESIDLYKKALDAIETANIMNSESLKKDIQFNKSLVEKLLQEQEQKDKQNKQNQQDKQDQQNQQDKQDQQNQQDKQDQQNQQDKQDQQNQQDKQDQQNQQDKQDQQNQQGQKDQQSQQDKQDQQNQQGQQDQQNQQGQENQQNQQDKQDQQNQQGQKDQQSQQDKQDQQGQQNQQGQQGQKDQKDQLKQQEQQNSKDQENNKNSNMNNGNQQENPKDQKEDKTQSSYPNDKEQGKAGKSDKPSGGSTTNHNEDNAKTLEQHAMESWLRTIPDDPGGLLKRKFLQQREQENREHQRKGSW